MKKINNFIKSRSFVITLFLVFIALIIAGVTYAWFTWSSTDNTNMTMQIGEYTVVTFSGGNAINVNNLAPVYNYTDGESTSFSLTNNNDDITKEFKYNVYLDITTISNELKTTVFKYILLDGSSNIIDQGNFSTASNGSTLTITENKTLPNGNSSYTFIIYIDGNEENNANMMNKSLSGSLRVVVERKSVTAANYITNLYNTATKSTATVNNITYNLAPSVGLMNDRHASMSTDINGGDIRFYGANPNNYVWLGDSYTGGNWTSYGAPFADVTACNDWATQQNITGEQIQEITNNKYSTVAEFCTTGEQKKLWRIVGIFDGRLKLVSNDPISTTTGLSWDTSANTTGGNAGYGINQWGPSDTYEGADIMRLLNPGYEGESINNSLYWTKGTGTVYTGLENATTSNVSFANTGLTANERNMIDTATWYTGAYDNISYVDAHYTAERGSMGKICTQGTSECDDTVTRINTWNGKVGLISASDYGYAADLSQCNQILNNYSSCTSSNWLFIGIFEWTMSSRANSGYAYNVFFVFGNGGLDYADANNGNAVRPAVFLKSGVSIDIDGKDGSFEHPYVLSLN